MLAWVHDHCYFGEVLVLATLPIPPGCVVTGPAFPASDPLLLQPQMATTMHAMASAVSVAFFMCSLIPSKEVPPVFGHS
jgi:hypothetical protein